MITSSLSWRWKLRELNSGPITGRSFIPGTPSSPWATLLWNNPPMAKLWPLAISTVVSARRVVSAGIVMLLSLDRPPVGGTAG